MKIFNRMNGKVQM